MGRKQSYYEIIVRLILHWNYQSKLRCQVWRITRSKGGISIQACAAYRTHNTQQTERRNSSVDENPAYEMVEGEHEVGKDDSDAHDYDYIETFRQS